MQIVEVPTNYQINYVQWKLNRHDDFLTNGKNFLQGKNPTKWISGHHSQESINQ